MWLSKDVLLVRRRLHNVSSIFLFLAISLVGSSVLAQESYYYYGGGEQRALFLSPQKVAVKFILTLTQQQIENFVTTDISLDPNQSPERTTNDFYILHILPENNVETLISRLRNRTEILFANPVYLTPDSLELIATDELVAKFYPGITRADIDSLSFAYGAIVSDTILGLRNVYVLKLSGLINKDVLVTANQYYYDSRVIYAHPNFFAKLTLHSIPSDSFFYNQWNYHNVGQTGGRVDADIDAPLAWDISTGDSSIRIAIIGQGVETHEDFPPDFYATGIDLVGPDVFHPRQDGFPWPGDSCGHEQACAGLIVGAHNTIGIAGSAPQCKIIAIKIAGDTTLWPCWYQNYNWCCLLTGNEQIIANAFWWAGQYGAQIASCSWGFSCYYYNDVIAEACSAFVWPTSDNPAGRVIVSSAGNNRNKYGQGCVEFPANLPTVLAVGATDSLDEIAWYSSPGPELDLAAPSGAPSTWGNAGNIYTTDLMGARGYNPTYIHPPTPPNINYTGTFGGTSASTPQVAGTCALIMAQYKHLYADTFLTGSEVMDIAYWSAEDSCYIFGGCASDTSWDNQSWGHGRLNAFRALLAISRGDVNNDKSLAMTDIVYLVNYLFKQGPTPVPVAEMGDANCDGMLLLLMLYI